MTSLTQQAMDQIQQGIFSGKYSPTSRLNIDALKRQFKMGGTPIREALSHLANTGLVELQPLKGFRVTPISKADVVDLYQTRELIEKQALALAIENGDDQWEGAILSAHHQLIKLEQSPIFKTRPNLAKWLQLHAEFYQSIFSACPSLWLLKLQKLLYEQSERYRYQRLLIGDSLVSTLAIRAKQHEFLVKLVLDRDTDKSIRALKAILSATVTLVLREWQND